MALTLTAKSEDPTKRTDVGNYNGPTFTGSNTLIAAGGVDMTYAMLHNGTTWVLSLAKGLNPAVVDGYRESKSFHRLNVTTNMDMVVVPISGGNTTNSDFLVPKGGSILGIAVYLNATMTSGTLNVWPTINGVTTATSAAKVAMTKAAGSNKIKVVTLAKDAIAISQGDLLGIKIKSGTTFAPVTADLNVTLQIET